MANPSFFGLTPQETALALEQERMRQLPQKTQYFAGDINFAKANQELQDLGPRIGAAISERSLSPLVEGGLGGFRDPRMQKALMLDEAKQEVANSGVNLEDNPLEYYNSAFTSLMKRGLVDEANQVRAQALSEMQMLKPTASQQITPFEFKDGYVINTLTGEIGEVPGYDGDKNTKVTYQTLRLPDGTFTSVAKGSKEEENAFGQGAIPTSVIGKDKTEKTTKGKFGDYIDKQVADNVDTLWNNAKNAPKFAEAANNIEAMLVSGAITGPGSQLKLAFARTMGFMGAETEAIAASEQLFKSLAETTLAAIPSSGLGTGQGFTDKDLKFLQAAVSGEISFTPATLKKVAEYNRKLADTSVKTFNSYYSSLSKEKRDVLDSGGISPINIPEIPEAVTSENLLNISKETAAAIEKAGLSMKEFNALDFADQSKVLQRIGVIQ